MRDARCEKLETRYEKREIRSERREGRSERRETRKQTIQLLKYSVTQLLNYSIIQIQNHMISKTRYIKHLVIHCSAGYAGREGIERFWNETLKWKVPGYHFLIEVDGLIHQLLPLDQVSNGVKGYNQHAIHICYVGGVHPENVHLAMDTRTEQQQAGILNCIFQSLAWPRQFQDISTIKILGHRDFSPDKNGNGIIEPWERIKECPSFEAILEYQWIMKRGNEV